MYSDIRESFVTGLVLLVPVASVLIVLQWFSENILRYFGVLSLEITGSQFLDQFLSYLTIISITFLAVLLIGYIGRTIIGKFVEEKIDWVFDRMPVIGRVYSVVKNTSKEIIEQDRKLEDPVKVETNGLRRTAFRTGNTTEDGREILFMPTSPNITSGFVIEVEPSKIEDSDQTVEEALEKLLTAGFRKK